ncbi:MAG: biotin/lipoyl-containing protein [Candidatus Limnocylindrales bacterium]
MPEAGRQRERQDGGSDSSRASDHAGIARLTEELLPALIAKLSTSQLGELEVREGDWHVRLRRPYGNGPGEGRRASDKASRSQPGHEGHGHGRAAVEGHRPSRSSGSSGSASGSGGSGGASGVTAGSGAASASTNGSGGGARSGGARDGDGSDRSRVIATSPAVGTFKPGPRAASGTRVRAGDSLGMVDMLGVPQEIPAPADGIVGQTLVEAGMAVEYGQELIRLELTAPATPTEPR